MKVAFFFLLLLTLFGNGYAASNKEEFELQVECERRAKVRFKEEFNNIDDSYSYQNHYNRKMNKCFIHVWSLGKTHVEYLFDVNEKQNSGMIIMENDGTPRSCGVLVKPCSS